MKTKRLQIVLTAMVAALSVHACLAQAASYKVDWQTVGGGGGNCRGGRLSLVGTVGQTDAGNCTSSSFVQQGGFIPAFQKTVGPPLRMTRSGSSFVFTWPAICTGFVLEGARDVTGTWATRGSGVLNGGNYQVTLTPIADRYFRLRKDCPQ